MKRIHLPHTWNDKDGQDGGNDYFRGRCAYFKKLGKIDPQGQEVYLEFLGVSQVAEVYLNGEPLFTHKGGYSTFRVNLTPALKENNFLTVIVDNSSRRDVYPQRADFTFYGGIYRDVNLIYADPVHFDLDYFGSKGIFVTPHVDGHIDVAYRVKNGEGHKAKFVIYDASHQEVAKQEIQLEGEEGSLRLFIDHVHLWDGKNDPYLYELDAQVGEDQVSTRFGVRECHVDPSRGFILNGREYPLIGVSMHQDRQGVGCAVSKAMHEEDFSFVLEMGANTIRLAHYQHDPYVYELADRYGLILWAEIPYISEHMEEAKENTKSQLTELILQNFNHPSVFTWGLSNEITVTGGLSEDCLENHIALNDLAHHLDPSRPTTAANVFMLETNSPLVRVPDLRSYNLYYGWYVGEWDENDSWLDSFHEKYPDLAIGLSEYGADANPAYQASHPVKGDYTESYQALYHEHMMEMRSTRPYIWAMHVWNLFDFGADGRDEGGKKGQNQKGLVTFDRKIKKDAFYLYKAYLSKEPFVHLCGKRYRKRNEEKTVIRVYSNQKHVELYVNHQLIGKKDGGPVFIFEIPLEKNITVQAVAGAYSDSMKIKKVQKPCKDYTCPQKVEVVNWFDLMEDPIDPECFSIKDKVIDIKNHPVAGKLYGQMMAQAMEKIGDVAKGVKIPKFLQNKLDQMTLEANLKMAGHMVSPDMVVALNKELQKIKK